MVAIATASADATGGYPADVPRVLLTPRWLVLHALASAMIATCAGLSWWQFERAGPGNASSFGYALQWPGFALFVLAVWAWLCRDAARHRGPNPTRTEPVADRVPDDVALPPRRTRREVGTEEPELAAYNAMLARLNAGEGR